MNLSTELKEQFCSLFDIQSLGKVIQTKIKVENNQPSTSLTDFYRHSIDLIQHFLLSEKLISAARSKDLSDIFSRMQFLCVDRIDLSYCHADTVKVLPTTHGIDAYVDEGTRKFYILKKFEHSEMRFTEAMAYFIVEDKTTRSKLLLHIRELLQVYQKEDASGLAKQREKITENYEPKWTIPEETKKDVPVVSPSVEEKTSPTRPEISRERIDVLLKEASLRPKLPSRAATKETETESEPSKFLPPLNTNNDPSKLQSDDSTERGNTPSPQVSNTNDPDHRVPEDRQREHDEHRVPKKISDFSTGEYRILQAFHFHLIDFRGCNPERRCATIQRTTSVTVWTWHSSRSCFIDTARFRTDFCFNTG